MATRGQQPVSYSIMSLYLLCLPLVLKIGMVSGNLPPVLLADMNLQVVSEATSPGTLVYTLRASDPEGSTVTYGLTGSDSLSVDPRTGQVTVVKPLDREEKDTLRLMVTVEDVVPGATNNIVRVPVNLIVIDANDNQPIFSRNTYDVVVQEDTPVGTTILAGLVVSDVDQIGEILKVSCQPTMDQKGRNNRAGCDVVEVVSSEATTQKFTGSLVLTQPLTYNDGHHYNFRIVASDGEHIVSVEAHIRVQDVQNSPPVFSGSLTGVVSEDDPIGSLVMILSAADGDIGDPRPIMYTLLSNPLDFFRVDPDNGELRTAKPLDRESLPSADGVVAVQAKAYEVTRTGVAVGGGSTEAVVTLTITIRDVNDEPPTFNKREYRATIPENVPDGTPLPNLHMIVQDTDVGSNSVFSLRLLDSSGMFSVEPELASGSTSISLRVAHGPLDYENPNQRKFIIQVLAEETLTNPRLSTTATVVVSLTDTNDNAPTFEQEAYTAVISETASPGTVITTITASDRDTGIFGMDGIKYSLFGNGAEKFDVDINTGVITIAKCVTPGRGNCLDYDDRPTYFLSFQATDNGGIGHTTVVPIRVALSDSNDNPPRFIRQQFRAVIDESASDFDPPLIVKAVDVDVTSEIIYSLVGGDPNGLFKMDPKSGRIVVASDTGLDISNLQSDLLILTVQANDGTGSHTANVEVSVRDVNNNKPIFVDNYYAASIQENAPPGSTVEQVASTDADTGVNALILYRIHRGGYDDFVINNTTGLITVARRLDYDRRNNYSLSVVAIDGGIPRYTSTAMVDIKVINNNDKNPYFAPTTQRTQVTEDTSIGEIFYQLTAEDPDIGNGTKLHFNLDGVVAAVDSDGKPLNHLQFEGLREMFVVDIITGEVSVANQLDRSIATEVTLAVSVMDNSATPPQVGNGALVITLMDVNDFPPVFPPPWSPESPILTVSISEELPLGSLITTITANDVDSNIGGYKLLIPSEHFDVDSSTGVVTVNGRLDYEQQSDLNFTLIAWDTGIPTLSATATIIVKLENINDEEPSFSEASYRAKVEENSPVGTTVIKVTAQDQDKGILGTVHYKLVGVHEKYFSISSTGLISVRDGAVLDREKLQDITLRIVAFDGALEPHKRTTSVPLYIKVTDVNDHGPAFSQGIYSASVVENLSINPPAPIVQVLAHDGDTGINAMIQYTITKGNEQSLFQLNPVSGILYPAKQLRAPTKEKAYQLTVEAKDLNGTGSYSDTATIKITILPQNQHKPKFILPVLPNATVTVPENSTTAELIVMTVSAADKDGGSNGDVRYHLRVGDENVQETTQFHLDPVSGVLKTKMVLDREYKPKYELVLVAKDEGSPISYETLRFLTVLLEDVNDNRPLFPRHDKIREYRFSIVENSPKNSLVGKIQAIDPDAGKNAQVNYYIVYGNNRQNFYIDKLHGSIYTNSVLDREEHSKYQLIIKAANDPNFVLRGQKDLIYDSTDPTVTSVTVIVEDINDTPPKFNKDVYYAGVSHAAEVERFVRMVTAQDDDEGINGTLTYSIRASNLYRPGEVKAIGSIIPSPFNITQEGKLMTASLMSQYRRHRFILEIQAKEGAPPHRIAMCKINIWVWEREELVRVVLAHPPELVVGRQDDVMLTLSKATEGTAVVDEIRYHIDTNNHVNREWTDMLVHVVNKSDQVMEIPEVLRRLDLGYIQLTDQTNGFIIEDIYPAYIGIAEEEVDARLAGLIALMIVLFIGFITFIVVCCCLRFWVLSPAGRSREQLIKRNVDDDLGLNTTENPLWVDQKLKTYEEQELSMQVMSEFDASNSVVNPNGNPTSSVTVDAEWSPERRSSLEFTPIDAQSNTYATIQKSHGGTIRSLQLRNLQYTGTVVLGEEPGESNDYATLDHLRKHPGHHTSQGHHASQGPKVPGIETPLTAFAHDPETSEYHELRTSFTGSTFQVPEPSNLANRPLPDEPFEGRQSHSSGPSVGSRNLSLNAQGEPVLVAELI